MNGHDFANRHLLCGQSMTDSVGNKSPQAFFVQMLQLATTTDWEMLAGRGCMVRTVDQAACRIDDITWRGMRDIAALGGDAIAARCDPDNLFWTCHSAAPCP